STPSQEIHHENKTHGCITHLRSSVHVNNQRTSAVLHRQHCWHSQKRQRRSHRRGADHHHTGADQQTVRRRHQRRGLLHFTAFAGGRVSRRSQDDWLSPRRA